VALTAVCAKINAPIFSVKHPEAFQIGAALPVPQPSALVGALAYCLGVHKGIGVRALEEARRVVVMARAKLMKGTTTITPIILRRFRILDKGLEAKAKGKAPAFDMACNALQSGDFEAFRKTIEVDLMDALYREYISNASIKCAWILRGPFDSKLLYLLQRLGDTESLVTVEEAWSATLRSTKVDRVSTDYPLASTENVSRVRGDYTMLRMCDEKRSPTMYYVPCRREVLRTPDDVKYFVYAPTKIDVEFKQAIEVFVIDEEETIGG